MTEQTSFHPDLEAIFVEAEKSPTLIEFPGKPKVVALRAQLYAAQLSTKQVDPSTIKTVPVARPHRPELVLVQEADWCGLFRAEAA